MPSTPHVFRKVVSIDDGGHRRRVLEKRNKLIEEYTYLVRPIADRIMLRLPPSFDIDDLIQTGLIGLLHAATRYRPGHHGGAPFSAYARPRIKGAIIDSVRRRHWTANTCVALDDDHDQVSHETPIEVMIDGARFKRIVERQRFTNDQAAVLSEYYSIDQPSIATVAARLGMPEWKAVRAHTEALETLRKIIKAA